MSDKGQLVQCPRCGSHVESLLPVETGMRVALQAAGKASEIQDNVCKNCYEQMTGMVSQGVRLRLEEEARQKNKMMLWKSRTNLIKQGRMLMSQKAFSEAAVSLEKYLKILEMVHNVGKGELTPEHFKDSIRTKELTIITSVYWDLFRIYDMSPKYLDRMKHAGGKLSLFLSYSTIYPDIIKKAESFQRSAKHPGIVKDFLKKTRKSRPMCFIATAVFAAPMAPEVQNLRRFRDNCLKKHRLGRSFIVVYYKYSPRIARFLEDHPGYRAALKPPLRFLSQLTKKIS